MYSTDLKNILNQATKLLTKYKIHSSRLDAELLLSFAIGQPREFFYTHPEHRPKPHQIQRFNALIQKRIKHIPVAYIIHHQEFFGSTFWVNKNVLIPRTETEIIVEKVISLTRKHFPQNITIADIGTGSGCIATSLAKNIIDAKIHATDISNKALYIARKNANSNNVKSKITFHHGDLFMPILNKKIDIVVANLPYVPQTYSKKLNKFYNTGLEFEPNLALYSGKDGLDHYRRFFKQMKLLKNTPRLILIEIDSSQVLKLKKIISQNTKNPEIKIIRDLNQKDRFLQIKLAI